MDSNDGVPSNDFPEEKLPDGIDEDASWFSKNLGDESDNTEHEVLNPQINQDDLNGLDSVKDNELVQDNEGAKSSEEMMETDSQSELLTDMSDDTVQKNSLVTLEPKKDELTELKDIAIDSKKHDISNELKEMFEEKSSDAEELHESSLTKHSLDSDITKEDKLKDIVPDDILGKDDSFDELDNDALHQELEAHLTYEKSKDLIDHLPDTGPEDLPSQDKESLGEESEHDEGQPKLQSEPEISKSLEDLNFEGKTDLLKNLTENIDAKEIDEIMEQGLPCEDDSSSKDITSELKEISSDLETACVEQIKDDLENQLQTITGENVDNQLENVDNQLENMDENVANELESLPDENVENELQNIPEEKTDEIKEEADIENALNEEIVNQGDKSSIDINQENMMVEFAQDDSGNQVLIQINEEKTEQSKEDPKKPDSVDGESSNEQGLAFSTDSVEASCSENDMISQVEGGAEFLQAVTGKLEDVLNPVKEETIEDEELSTKPTEEPEAPPSPAKPASPTTVTVIPKKEDVKDESPKCCITTCKSGKSTLRTTYRYFKPPVNKILYKKWEYIFNQARQQISPTSLICELHFRTGLIYKRGIDKFGKVVWALREGALPKLNPSGVLRVSTGAPTPPSTTVQVPKKPEGLIKSPATPVIKPLTPTFSASTSPKVVAKKILQKPVKTVATKVTSEVTDIGFLYKNPELIKVAQDEMANLDVLVCGECHSVFHILELFQAHKMANNCRGESNFKGNPAEPKPQVWAFLLWKSAQSKVSDVDSSWRLYQRWCKMDEELRDTWIAAGKSLQEGNTISSLKMFDTPIKARVGRPPLRDRESEDEDYSSRKPLNKKPRIQKISSSEYGAGDASPYPEIEPMEVENSQVSPAKPDDRAHDQTLEELSRHTPEMITADVEIKQEVMSDEERGENKENDNRQKESDDIQTCTRCKLPVENPKEGITCAAGCYGFFHVQCTRLQTYKALSKLGSKRQTWKCDECKVNHIVQPSEKPKPLQPPQPSAPMAGTHKPLDKDTDEEEFVVEKIVSRRYNIKKKHFEYLLKWEGYPSEQNTWEPAENLGTCQHLLKAFEEALAKQQAAKAATMGKTAPPPRPPPDKVKPPIIPKRKPDPVTPGPSVTTPLLNILGRPVRSSKQKAMNQVKRWCGSIVKPSEDDNVGMKRKLSSDSEYDEDEEVVVKRVKVEVDSDDSDMDTVRRVQTTPARGRGRPPGSTNAARLAQATANYLNKPMMNGEQKESNLAAALGLESDEDEFSHTVATPSQKSPVIQKMSSLSPHNQQVLVASAKGVVTVDPKKVPNLSSGVYIMSNKSGIVKVDNNKTLSTLQKSGILKKPLAGPLKSPVTSSPEKSSSGVVVLPRSEAGTPQQKSGVIKKALTPSYTSPATTTATTGSTPARPAGLLKPLRPGLSPRPLGLLKPSTAPPTATPTSPPALALIAPKPTTTTTTATASPRLSASSALPKPQLLAKAPRPCPPLHFRQPLNSPLVKKPVDNAALQASIQQRILIAKKKAESEATGDAASKKPLGADAKPPLVKPKVEPGLAPLPPIKSTNKVFAHPLLGRGRGRGGFRGRGRGTSLSQLMLVNQTQREPVVPQPDPIKDSKLVESDNMLMEFQEPSDSEESDDGLDDGFPSLEELPPIEPDSPPRPLSLCPLTGKVLCKAEGEKTPEPTPPPSPKAPTPPPPPPAPVTAPTIITPTEEPTHILPDNEEEEEKQDMAPVTHVTHTSPQTVMTPTTTIVKQDGMICKVEMSPGGTTGTLVEAISADMASPPNVTEGTVTIKKPLASRNRLNRGPQLSVMPTNSTSTSLGTITVPARKLFQEDNGDDDLVTITGEDGLVYQVSNSELAGNTLLVSSGEDGQQQCVYVTTEGDGTEEGGTILTLDSAYADAVAQLGTDQVNILSTENGDQFYIKEDDGGQLMAMEEEEGMGVVADDQSGQVVAQLVEAGEPAPGGSRRVVLLLPDGNLMMTEVDEEQYAALDLDK